MELLENETQAARGEENRQVRCAESKRMWRIKRKKIGGYHYCQRDGMEIKLQDWFQDNFFHIFTYLFFAVPQALNYCSCDSSFSSEQELNQCFVSKS